MSSIFSILLNKKAVSQSFFVMLLSLYYLNDIAESESFFIAVCTCLQLYFSVGKHLISMLSDELVKEYGKGFSEKNLRYFRKFYIMFPDCTIVNACVHNLKGFSLLKVLPYNGICAG